MEQSNNLQDFISLIEAGMMATTVYLTVITGYLVAAYMAGADLGKSQLAIISVLFLLFSLLFSVASFMLFQAAMLLPFDDGAVGEGAIGSFPFIILAGEVLGILAAMKFMLDMRHND